MNILNLARTTRAAYLTHLWEGGQEITITYQPHEPSGVIKVWDSNLGYCPKKAALRILEIPPSHPKLLSEESLEVMHLMRSGIETERDWIASFRYYGEANRLWQTRYSVPLHASTRGYADIMLDLEQPVSFDYAHFDRIICEVKRTDGNLKRSYLLQLASYLSKSDVPALGKLITDHRHTFREYTLNFDPDRNCWLVWDNETVIDKLPVQELAGEIERHQHWLKLIQNSAFGAVPDDISCPLCSWECHKSWRKRAGKAQFRCPWAGYCWEIEDYQFSVKTARRNGHLVRIMYSDQGERYEHKEL